MAVATYDMNGKQFARVMAYLECPENLNEIHGARAYNVTLVRIHKIDTKKEEYPFIHTSHRLGGIVLGFHNLDTEESDRRKIKELLEGE